MGQAATSKVCNLLLVVVVGWYNQRLGKCGGGPLVVADAAAFLNHIPEVVERGASPSLAALWTSISSSTAENVAHPISQELVRYRARVAYDGAGFDGFQIQSPMQLTTKQRKKLSNLPVVQKGPQVENNANNLRAPSQYKNINSPRTVQGELELVLNRRFGHPDRIIRVVAAGRTDAGVHARGQAIHFDVPADKVEDVAQLEYSLNSMLPPDLCIWNIQPAPAELIWKEVNGVSKALQWNVMYDSSYKLYSYRFAAGSAMHPIERHHRWHPSDHHINTWFDAEHFQSLLRLYEGTHNFRAFAGAVEQLEKRQAQFKAEQRNEGRSGDALTLDTVRTVYKVDLVCEDAANHHYRIDFSIEGALYKQIRNMVGTIMEVCRPNGRLSETDLRRLLLHEPWNDSETLQPSPPYRYTRRDNPSKPAPPQGLTLEHVFFDNDPGF